MRSRATNILQCIVLLTGIVYIIMGLAFFASPITVMSVFIDTKKQGTSVNGQDNTVIEKVISEEESEESGSFADSWLKQISSDEVLAPLYFMFRVFAALLFTCGISMIMPLFDPLKYRLLIYFNGVFFPLLVTILFLAKMISLSIEMKGAAMAMIMSSGHLVVFIAGITFTALLVFTFGGLMVTRKQANEGVE